MPPMMAMLTIRPTILAPSGVRLWSVQVPDGKAHARKAARDQATQKAAPLGLRLDLAHGEADHLAPARLVQAVGDQERLLPHHARRLVADTLDARVEPEVGVGPLSGLPRNASMRSTPSCSTSRSTFLVETPLTRPPSRRRARRRLEKEPKALALPPRQKGATPPRPTGQRPREARRPASHARQRVTKPSLNQPGALQSAGTSRAGGRD